ncbi:MAG: thioredoxin domain-containing protein [Candidatus Kapaibacterium sp.]
MKKYSVIVLVILAFLANSCTGEQSKNAQTKLEANDFAAKIKALPSAPIIDVRTPAEFAKGHLQNAMNIDWNGDSFDTQIAHVDKSKPVLVYCLSGARSAAAASKMRSSGYKEVYELQGGIMKWNAAGLPVTTANSAAPTQSGMTKQQFLALLASDKPSLVDFYADWCAPCKEMKPYLDEISKDMSDKVHVVRINVDEHPALCKELNISDLPVVQLYKNASLVSSSSGFMDKATMISKINSLK